MNLVSKSAYRPGYPAHGEYDRGGDGMREGKVAAYRVRQILFEALRDLLLSFLGDLGAAGCVGDALAAFVLHG